MPRIEYRCPRCNRRFDRTAIADHYTDEHGIDAHFDAFSEMYARGYLDVVDGENVTGLSVNDFFERTYQERSLVLKAGQRKKNNAKLANPLEPQKSVEDFFDASKNAYVCVMCKAVRRRANFSHPSEFTAHLTERHDFKFSLECIFCGMGSEVPLGDHERSCRYRVRDITLAPCEEGDTLGNRDPDSDAALRKAPVIRKEVQCFYVYAKNSCVCDHCCPLKDIGNFQQMTQHLEAEHGYEFSVMCAACGCGCLTKQSLIDHRTICQGINSPIPTPTPRITSAAAVTALQTPPLSSPVHEPITSPVDQTAVRLEPASTSQPDWMNEIFGPNSPEPSVEEKKNALPVHVAKISSTVITPPPEAAPRVLSPLIASPAKSESSSSSSSSSDTSQGIPELVRALHRPPLRPVLPEGNAPRLLTGRGVPLDCAICERKRQIGCLPLTRIRVKYPTGRRDSRGGNIVMFRCMCPKFGPGKAAAPGRGAGVAMMRGDSQRTLLKCLPDEKVRRKRCSLSDLEADTPAHLVALCDDLESDSDLPMERLRRKKPLTPSTKMALRVMERGKRKTKALERMMAKEMERRRTNGESTSDECENSEEDSPGDKSEESFRADSTEVIDTLDSSDDGVQDLAGKEEPEVEPPAARGKQAANVVVKKKPLGPKSARLWRVARQRAAKAGILKKATEPSVPIGAAGEPQHTESKMSNGIVKKEPRSTSEAKQAEKKGVEQKEVIQFFVAAWNRYRCDLCSDPHPQFMNIQDMASHLVKAHQYKYAFTCEFCNFGSSKKASLRIHNEVCRERWPDAHPDAISSDESCGQDGDDDQSSVEEVVTKKKAKKLPPRTDVRTKKTRSPVMATESKAKNNPNSTKKGKATDKEGPVSLKTHWRKKSERAVQGVDDEKTATPGTTSYTKGRRADGEDEPVEKRKITARGKAAKKGSANKRKLEDRAEEADFIRRTTRSSGMASKNLKSAGKVVTTPGKTVAPNGDTAPAKKARRMAEVQKKDVGPRRSQAKLTECPGPSSRAAVMLVKDPVKCFDSEVQCFVCPKCDFKAPSLKEFSNHLEKKHKRSFKYHCLYCNLGTDSSAFMREHKGLCTMRWPDANALVASDDKETSEDEELEPVTKRKKAEPRKERRAPLTRTLDEGTREMGERQKGSKKELRVVLEPLSKRTV